MKKSFSSVLQPIISQYLTHKEVMGSRYTVERHVLKYLDRFLTETQAIDLNADTFKQWCDTQLHLTSGVRRNRMRIVRNFCLYRRRTDIHCFVPELTLFPSAHQPLKPYIFTSHEIIRLIQSTETFKSTPYSPLRREVFRLAIVLLYTTGLRRGELLRLTIEDYDPASQTLLVRESKFHKSRFLPLSSDATRELDLYLRIRKAHCLPTSGRTPLIWNRYDNGRGYTASSLGWGMKALFRIVGVLTPEDRSPRIHDFRHTFAVHALLRWYRNGVDINSKLPLLAVYMGHVSIASTEYYLSFVDELAATSSARFAKCYSALVIPLDQKGDDHEK